MLPLSDDNSGRRSTPVLIVLLIAVNAFVWFLQLTLGEAFTAGYSAVPYEITHNQDLVVSSLLPVMGERIVIPQAPGPSPIYLTMLSSMFMHGSWMHILGNMLYLWIFGDQIEDLLGKFKFLAFYILCGLGAGVAQIITAPDSIIPCLGASGAIAGVLGAYLVKYPSNPVQVLAYNRLTEMPAYLVLGFWIVLQFFGQVGSAAGQATGVAYMAHIGGFITGVILIFLLGGRRPAGY